MAKAYQKNPRFARKVLTPLELERFEVLKGQRQMAYLAGRWSAKEAYAKAAGTGIGPIGFQDIEILTTEKGAPIVHRAPLPAKVWLSISHSGDFVQASVILEVDDESQST